MPGRTRVMVADDNGTYGALLARFVSSQPDMEVVGLACDGSEAVDLAALVDPDLVLMDLCMPGLDGIEATRVLLATHAGLKVIALTAHCAADTERVCFEAGASGFIRKSDADEGLLDLIRTIRARGSRRHDPRGVEDDGGGERPPD